LKSSWVTILQVVEFSIFVLILAWALQQCSATALPGITDKRVWRHRLLCFFYKLFFKEKCERKIVSLKSRMHPIAGTATVGNEDIDSCMLIVF